MSELTVNKGRKKLIFSILSITVFVSVLFFARSLLGQPKSDTVVSRFNTQQWDVVPSEAVLEAISNVETSVILPSEAYSIESYFRFYAVGEHEGEKVLYAVFTHKSFGKYMNRESLALPRENAFFVLGGRLPLIADGGCSVINIIYNLAEPLGENEKIIVTGPPDLAADIPRI